MLRREGVRKAEKGKEKKRPGWMEERRDLTVTLHDSKYVKMTVWCDVSWLGGSICSS